MTQQTQKPTKEFRAGTIKAAVWKQQQEEGARSTIHYSVKIEKRYFDEASKEWRNTDYFFANDLPRLRLVAERAFEFITLHESEEA